jgi:hypothetical protein
MEIPGKVSVYCPLIDAKGTAATLVSISPQGYYQVEVPIKGMTHVMFLPVAHTALYFSDPDRVRLRGNPCLPRTFTKIARFCIENCAVPTRVSGWELTSE